MGFGKKGCHEFGDSDLCVREEAKVRVADVKSKRRRPPCLADAARRWSLRFGEMVRSTKRRCGVGPAPDVPGINFLVPCGTTGESPTLTHEEHLRVVAITIEEAKGKVPVLAGAGGNNTAK